jgi:hypothetical protein
MMSWQNGNILEDQPAFDRHITKLFMSLSLRSVELKQFHFSNSACQAVALALRTGSPITYLNLAESELPYGECSIAHALQRKSTLETLRFNFQEQCDEGFCNALASALPINTTLTDLTVHTPCYLAGQSLLEDTRVRVPWLQPFFVALRMNTSLKKVDVDYMSMSDELECAALRDVFAKNSVLEELTLRCDNGSLLCDTDLISWRRTLPFLRDNKTLKSFKFFTTIGALAANPHAATFCINTVSMLGDNSSRDFTAATISPPLKVSK